MTPPPARPSGSQTIVGLKAFAATPTVSTKTGAAGYLVGAVLLLAGLALVGFVAYPSALAVVFSPVEPSDEVKTQLAAYDRVPDPDTGLTLEYRRWGDPTMDQAKETIECNYGYAVAETKGTYYVGIVTDA